MGIDISIIVPTHNRKEKLLRCLNSLFRQDYPREKFEIIVVDDSADDEVGKILYGLKKTYANIRYLAQCHEGPAKARNLGSNAALGEFIGFIDDDCTVCDDWIRLMAQGHRNNPDIAAVGGVTLTATQKTPVLVSQFLSTCSIETDIGGRQEAIFFPTCNVSLKRQIFDKYKFNEDFPLPGGEDLEFFWRLFKNGYSFIWDKNIKVIHYREDTFPSFIKQAYIYGRGNLLVQHIHRDQPLLKELKTGRISFWAATLINAAKIPRFSYLLGRKLIQSHNIKNTHKKLSVFAYFGIHKIFYLGGNITEFFRIKNLQRRNVSYSVPRLIILDITHSCNLSCRICDIWKTAQSEKDLDISYVKKMLSQAKGLGIKEIALSGGEPLLRKDIFDIFDYAGRMKIKDLGILTNGILVAKYLDRLKPYLLDNTISLVISLDSLNPQVHNLLRNSDLAWGITIESLNRLSCLKKEYPQVNFNVISIILNQNLREIIDLANFVKSLAANSLQLQVLLPNNLKMSERKESPFWVSEDNLPLLDPAIDKLIEFKKENPGFIRNSTVNLSLVKKYYRQELTGNDVKCFSAYGTILTSNQGTYTTCFSCYGDIKNSNLKDVLRGERIIAARRKTGECASPCLLPCFCDL